MSSTELLALVPQYAALTLFDYGTLSPDVANEMRARASRIQSLQRASVLDVGRELIAAKNSVEHGFFRNWVESACQLHIRTAERAMRAAALVGENDKLSYLPPDGLLALASRSAPQPVIAEIMEEIGAGERPSAAGIRRRIAEAKRTEKRTREQMQSGADLQQRGPNPAEEETSTDQVIEMLVTWHRIDELMALLETADLSRVVHAVRNRRNKLGDRTVVEADPAMSVHPTQPMLETEAAGLANYCTGQTADAESGNNCAAAAAEVAQLASPEPSSDVSAEQLLAMWSRLRPRSQWYGRQWVAEGAEHPLEHHVFTEALVSFRAAASRATEAELRRFLALTEPQAA